MDHDDCPQISPAVVLQAMQSAPLESGAYVLGSFERRVTIYSQQVRALNLIYALDAGGHLKGGDEIVVVGAGIAGLTATAAAVRRGFKVTLLEETSSLIPLQRGSKHRWLHPHLYDWPEPDSTDDSAGLPILDWTAGSAHDVSAKILQQFEETLRSGRVTIWFRVRHFWHLARDAKWRGRKDRPDDPERSSGDRSFGAIIFAVGFGMEARPRFVPENVPHSYWTMDPLEQRATLNGQRQYLVSGCGDGGLIDFLRLRLGDFEQHKLVDWYIESRCDSNELSKLTEALLNIEATARRQSSPSKFLEKEYRSLPVPKKIDEAIRRNLRPDTDVILNGREPSALTLRSSILNRFLVSRLLFSDDDGNPDNSLYIPGEPKFKKKNGKVLAVIGEKEYGPFDQVVIRHGPTPAITNILKGASVMHMRELAHLDMTRDRLWADGFFDGSGDRSVLRTRFDRAGLDFEGARRIVEKMGVDLGWRVTDDALHIGVPGLTGIEVPLRTVNPVYDPVLDEITNEIFDLTAYELRASRWQSPYESSPNVLKYLSHNLRYEALCALKRDEACKIGFVELDGTASGGEHNQSAIIVRPLNHIITWAFNRMLAMARVDSLRTAEEIWRQCLERFAMGPSFRMVCPSQLFLELAFLTQDGDVPIPRKSASGSVYSRRGFGAVKTCGIERGPNWAAAMHFREGGQAYLDLKASVADAVAKEYRIRLPWLAKNRLFVGDGPVLMCSREPIIETYSIALQCFHLNAALLGVCILPVTTAQLRSHLSKVRESGGLAFSDSPTFYSIAKCSSIIASEEHQGTWHGTALARLQLLIDNETRLQDLVKQLA